MNLKQVHDVTKRLETLANYLSGEGYENIDIGVIEREFKILFHIKVTLPRVKR